MYLAAMTMLLSASYWPEAESHIVYHVPRGDGGLYNQMWPTAFLHPRDVDLRPYRPFHSPRRHPTGGRRPYTTASPIVDMFQEVVGDIKRGEFWVMHILVVSEMTYDW